MPRKLCGWATDCRALIATSRLPSVPFLKPTGLERPEDISRWVWDSVVRAPIADQLMQSCRYCGEIGSSASVASGRGAGSDFTNRKSTRLNSSHVRISYAVFCLKKKKKKNKKKHAK